jgi:hypothetical protein
MAKTTDVLPEVIDIDPEAAPAIDRDRLYRLWERDTWSAYALDFALFLDGEESVTVTLAPFIQAVTRYEDRILLATQIADEARHHVFFDRWLREVAGIGTDIASTLEATSPDLTWGYRQVFAELDRVAERLRQHPRDRAVLA